MMFFTHPYYHSSAIFARILANLGTAIWAVLILSGLGVWNIDLFPAYETLAEIMPAQFWAGGGLLITVCNISWLGLKLKPIKLGVLGYVAIAWFWSYLTIAAFFLTPIPPTMAAAITVVAIAALYALIANPRRDESVA